MLNKDSFIRGKEVITIPSWNVANSASCLMKPTSTKGASGTEEATREAITSRSLRSWRS